MYLYCRIKFNKEVTDGISFEGFELTAGNTTYRLDFADITSVRDGDTVRFWCSDPLYDVFPKIRELEGRLGRVRAVTSVWHGDRHDEIFPVEIQEMEICTSGKKRRGFRIPSRFVSVEVQRRGAAEECTYTFWPPLLKDFKTAFVG